MFGLRYNVCFDLSFIDRHGSSYQLRVKYTENDLKGNENCLELKGGSSYRGFELSNGYWFELA